MALRTIPLDDLLATGRKVMAKAYLEGRMPERARLRTAPRDPEKLASLARYVSSCIRKNPIRKMENGMLWVPGVSE